MFASGYQVFKPAGIPILNKSDDVILYTVENERMVPAGDEEDSGYFIEIENLYEEVASESNIKVSQARTHQEIIRLVTTGNVSLQDAGICLQLSWGARKRTTCTF